MTLAIDQTGFSYGLTFHYPVIRTARAMRLIEVHGDEWKSALDFYNALIGALGGPEWCGRNINALMDLIVWDNNKAVEPYTIRVSGVAGVPENVRDEVHYVQQALLESRAECRARYGHDVEVHFEIKP